MPGKRSGAGAPDGLADIGRALDDVDAGGGQRFHLFSRCAFAAGDDRTRVAHPPAGRGGLAGDEADHGLLEVRPDPLGGFLLG